MPLAIVKPISWTALQPFSRMWYPLMLIVFHFGHVLLAVREEVRGHAHRGLGRVDEVAARDVLLEDVVLHGAAQLVAS